MREIDAIQARAIAYERFGTPGRHAPQDRAYLLRLINSEDAIEVVARELAAQDGFSAEQYEAATFAWGPYKTSARAVLTALACGA